MKQKVLDMHFIVQDRVGGERQRGGGLGEPNAEKPRVSWLRRQKGELGKLGAKEEVVLARTEDSSVPKRVVGTTRKLAAEWGAAEVPAGLKVIRSRGGNGLHGADR